jgi:hypothetical protein
LLQIENGSRFTAVGIAGLLRKKLNQSLTKFYPGIPDIGGQKTYFLPVKKTVNRREADRATPVMAPIFRYKPEKID